MSRRLRPDSSFRRAFARMHVVRLEDRLAPAVATWDGGGTDNNWTTAANWVGDVAPNPQDDLVFSAGAARLTNNNDFVAGTVFDRIDLRGPDYRIGGNDLVLINGITAQSPSPVAPANFPQLFVGLTTGGFSFKLSGDANLGVVLNGPLTLTVSSPKISGRFTISGVVSGNYDLTVDSLTADVVLTANNTNRSAAVIAGSLRIDGSMSPNASDFRHRAAALFPLCA